MSINNEKKILVFGAGWLGHKFAEQLGGQLAPTDISDSSAVAHILDEVKPEIVVNTAGKTGRPNIDWCEDHKIETINSNITGALVLMRACVDRGIQLAHLSSGCIFDGAAPGPNGFSEEDEAKPVSFYSWSKATADEILKKFPVLILRLRMPIDGEPGPRNLISKLASYPNIIDVENSVTIVDDLLSATAALIEKKKTGIYNVTNPGHVFHRDIMRWYKEIVDPSHVYTLIPGDELLSRGLTKAGRSNCVLDTTKLQNEGIILENAEDAIKACLREYALNRSKAE